MITDQRILDDARALVTAVGMLDPDLAAEIVNEYLEDVLLGRRTTADLALLLARIVVALGACIEAAHRGTGWKREEIAATVVRSLLASEARQ